MVNYRTLYEPPSDAYLDGLREDIRKNGVRHAIIVDERGTVLSGNCRKRIADELGIPCPSETYSNLAECDKVALAIAENPNARAISKEQRDQVVAHLLTAGWSERRIAAHIGVSVMTVQRTPTVTNVTGGEPRTGSDGKQYSPRSNPDETNRRRSIVKTLASEGYLQNQIADALNVGTSTVSDDFKKAAIPSPPRGTKPNEQPVPKERTKWRDSEVKLRSVPSIAPDIPRYKQMVMLRPLQLFREAFTDGSYANGFGHLVNEASNDPEWLDEQRQLLITVRDMVDRLTQVLNDPDYRRLATETLEGRERLRNADLKIIR